MKTMWGVLVLVGWTAACGSAEEPEPGEQGDDVVGASSSGKAEEPASSSSSSGGSSSGSVSSSSSGAVSSSSGGSSSGTVSSSSSSGGIDMEACRALVCGERECGAAPERCAGEEVDCGTCAAPGRCGDNGRPGMCGTACLDDASWCSAWNAAGGNGGWPVPEAHGYRAICNPWSVNPGFQCVTIRDGSYYCCE